MDWTLYWFMFPVSVGVATTAMLSGIGGAALFVPIFVIILPLIGPEYPLPVAAAIASALLTQVFGFTSGFIGYSRKGLIDFRSAVPFIRISIPVAIFGALLFAFLKDYEALLKACYATLVLLLCPIILRRKPVPEHSFAAHPAAAVVDEARPWRKLTSRAGQTYAYRVPRQGLSGGIMTGTGAFLTGFLGVGIGEVIIPQLIKRHLVPVAVAAAKSVFIIILTIAAASFTQVTALISAGGLDAVPWNLVCYTIPGVIIGGQLGPWMQGRIPQRTMEISIGTLFGLIGLAMMWIAFSRHGT